MNQHFPGYQQGRFILPVTDWLVPALLSVLLLIVVQFSYPLFHIVAELFAVIVALLISIVAWQMFAFTRNNYLMFLGCGFFWVGAMELVHLLSYSQLQPSAYLDQKINMQLWFAMRVLQVSVLLIAPFFLNHRINVKLVFALFGVYVVLVNWMTFSGVFNELNLQGHDVLFSLIIMLALFSALLLLNSKRDHQCPHTQRIMQAAIVFLILAELSFSLGHDIESRIILFGHALKLFAYWFIFVAIVRSSLHEPFTLMSRSANTYDAVPDATILIDREGIIHQVNKAACELAAMPKNMLIGKSSHAYFHPSQYTTENCPVCSNSRRGIKIDNLELADKENNRWLDYTLTPVSELTDVDGLVEIVRDVTERKQVEYELEDLSELKDSIVDNLPAMLFVKRASDHRYVEWNKAAEELTGLKREEMIGKNDYDFFTDEEAAFYEEMDNKVLSEGVLHDIPEEPIHTRNNGVRLLHTRKIPITNKHGKASYLLGISQDITEKRETEEMLRRSQKMEAVGQLSGGIAHDFNNQLGIVTGYLEFLKVFVQDHDKQKTWVDNALKAANRCVELTRQLLLFSRNKPAGRVQIDMNHVINGMVEMIERSVTPVVSITYQLNPCLDLVSLDQSELEDAIVNMVINSRDAMPDGGQLVIRTSNIYLDSDFTSASPGLKTGEYVMLEIKDSGTGMSPETIEHVFEPFFTTKPVGKGTGLGLSMVYAFVQRYEGSIKIDSQPAKGTSIKIYLPRVTEEDSAQETIIDDQHIMEMPKGRENLLIVDDEIDLLNLAGEYLEMLGYTIYKAATANEALDILSRQRIDLVFSDIVMPGGMNGYELADSITRQYPDTRVLLSSGYTGRSTGTVYRDGYKSLVLTKPYTQQDLAYRVRAVLDS